MYASVVARGSGWQDIGAYVNLGAYYPVGVLVGVVLAFVVHLKGRGLRTTGKHFYLLLKQVSQIGKNRLLVPKKKKFLSIYLFLLLHLSTTKVHVQLDHIV